MQAAFTALDGWLLRTTLGGGVVLLVGALWMLISRQPAKRQRVGELALLCALLVALPAALPTWWSLPGPVKAETSAHYAGSGAREATREETADLQLFDDAQADDTFELLQMLGILDERNNPVPVQADGPDELAQQPSCQDKDASASGLALLGGGDTPWFLWGLRAYGVLYIGFVLFLLGRCGFGYFGLWSYWRNRRPAPAHVHAALADLEPVESRRPRIGVCPHVHGPVSYGLWKPTILLSPAFCNEGDPEKLRWVLAHELTHLRRRDAWGCLLLALGGAVYFHLPWFWWLKRQVRLAQEYVADAAAAKIASAVDYAQYLVSLTSLTARPTLASGRAAGVFETQSDLYRRVHMLLRQRNVIEGGAPRWWTLSAAASFLALAACTAGVKVSAADEQDKKQVNVTVVTDDDDAKPGKKQSADKKQDKGTIHVELKVDDGDGKAKTQIFELKDGKLIPADGKGKTQVFEWKDGKLQGGDGGQFHLTFPGQPGQPGKPGQPGQPGKPGQWSFVVGDGQKQKLDEVMRKLDQVMARMSKEDQPELRAKLEEVKGLLKKMQSGSGVGVWNADGNFKLQSDEARKQGDEARRQLGRAKEQLFREQDRADVGAQRARALEERARAAERQARASADRALSKWSESKDGKDREEAVKELEKAIAEREAQLKKLRQNQLQGEGEGGERVRQRLRQGEEERNAARGRLSEEDRNAARVRALEQLKRAQDEKNKGDRPGGNKPRLGVSLTEVEDSAREEAKIPDGQGVMIADVVEDSPAWNNGKGLKSGDILVEFAGKKVSSDLGAFVKTVGAMKEGTYDAVVYRNGKKTTVRGIKFGAKDEQPSKSKGEKPAKNKKDDDEVSLEHKVQGNVILNLKDHLAQMDKLHGDAVVRLEDVRKHLKDGKGEIALELDGAKQTLDGIKGDLTLKLADVAKLEGLKKDVDHLVTLKLDDVKHGLTAVQPELAKQGERLALSLRAVDGAVTNVKPEALAGALSKNQGKPGDFVVHADGVLKALTKPGDVKVEVKSLPLTYHVVSDEQGSKPRLGVQLEAVPESVAAQLDLSDDRGLIVQSVTPGSAAEKAGIQKNDILIQFADKSVSRDHEAFTKRVRELKPGTYTATLLRKGKEVRIRNIVLGETAAKDDPKAKKDWMVEDEEKAAKAKDEAKRGTAKAKKDKEDSFKNAPNFGPAFGRNLNRNTSISINNGEFTAKSKINEDKTITVVGRVENNKAVARSITIKDGDEEKRYKSVNEVPEADRGDVEGLLKNIRGSGNMIRFGPSGLNFGGGAVGNLGPEFEAQMKLMEEQMKRVRDQLGQGNPGFDQIEKQLEEMRKQLRELRKEDK